MAQRKMLFAYIGKTSANGAYYENNYEALCTNFPDVTDIIISVAADYNQVGAHTTSGYSTIISGGDTSVNLVACTNVMKAHDMPFYVALPPVNTDSKHGTGSYSAEYANWKTYLSMVQTALTNNESWSLCKGFYLTNEIIAGTVDQNNIMGNTFAKLLNDIAYTIRSDPNSKYYREFIWAPYLGYNSGFMDINSDNGIIANRTNIFDMVLFQPHTYFAPAGDMWNPANYSGTPPENSRLAAKCAISNIAYTYASKDDREHYAIVAGSKTSSTKIGVDVEIDHRLAQNGLSDYRNSYNQQCADLKDIVGTDAPLVFYCGSGATQTAAANAVNQFFTDGTSIY